MPHGERLADRYGATAVDLVRRAATVGFFAAPAKVEMLEHDADFQPLFPRADFQELLLSVKNPPANKTRQPGPGSGETNRR